MDHWRKVEAFPAVFRKPGGRRGAADPARMERRLKPAVNRFKALDDPGRRRESRDALDGQVQRRPACKESRLAATHL